MEQILREPAGKGTLLIKRVETGADHGEHRATKIKISVQQEKCQKILGPWHEESKPQAAQGISEAPVENALRE